MLQVLTFVALLLQLTSAHFSIIYPYWRGDSFATQWERPCGGVNQSQSDGNRTLWPIDGGAIVVKGSHPWEITYVNIGFGDSNTTNFNISLVPPFNLTGNGTYCFTKVNLPSSLGIKEGQNASLQVIQVGDLGSSLYNCADITFSKNATLPSGLCTNSTGVGGHALEASSTCPANASSTKSSSATSIGPENLYPYIAVFVAGVLVLAANSL
ncbi:hypothetical protein GP486_003763 [Trichoglossum hirsutum]|uniref:Copper acquisition factor BIM1-like domain-containing protein n=1 Tax=Trichoglossum hirsutum TaxID=265104 RepID=A0A9P8LCN2_9PEZI|nr:hypothetical protein GP486_003763 [Trichoglossum hirsutum]